MLRASRSKLPMNSATHAAASHHARSLIEKRNRANLSCRPDRATILNGMFAASRVQGTPAGGFLDDPATIEARRAFLPPFLSPRTSRHKCTLAQMLRAPAYRDNARR